MERDKSHLGTRKTHNDCKHNLEPSAFDNKGHKELRIVRDDQRAKDSEVSSPDLWSVLYSVDTTENLR
jgi:hypothetical protein